mgnify:FL=1
MAEHVYLMGSEDVQRAGHAMSDAASTISQAMGSLHETLYQHRQLMDEMVGRFEAAVDRLVAAQEKEIDDG